jgi:hypothetical protein
MEVSIMVMDFMCESCGQKYSRQTYTVTAAKSSKEFWRSKQDTTFGTCPECYKKEQEEKRQNKMVKSGLLELSGSEKQISWALKIRLEKYEASERYVKVLKSKGIEVYDRLFAITEAKFWIDNRNSNFEDLMKLVAAMASADVEAEIKAEEEKESKAKMQVLLPENPVDETPVEVKVTEFAVSVISKKDEKIIEVCKNSGYTWKDGAWKKEIGFRTGPAIDRAADIGNKLLSMGYPVAIDNVEAAQKAVSAEYELECTRWISVPASDPNKFNIKWEGKNNELYETARSLPKSSYTSPYVEVSIKYFREVEDFAGLYGFKLSPGAIKAIAEYKESLEVKAVTPKKTPEQVKPKDGLKDILKSDTNIIDDLKD